MNGWKTINGQRRRMNIFLYRPTNIYGVFIIFVTHTNGSMYILFSVLLCLLYELVYCLTAGWRGIYWENWRWWTPWPSGWICVGTDSTFRYSKPFNLLSVLEELNLQTKYDIKINTRFYPFQRKMKVLQHYDRWRGKR